MNERAATTLRRALSVYQDAVKVDPDLAPDERHERLRDIADANAAIGRALADKRAGDRAFSELNR